MTGFEGIVLAGGNGLRLGGPAKPLQLLGSRPLLRIAVEALDGAARVVVVGPEAPGITGVTWVREEPPGGGPVAALAAALPLLGGDTVVVLAADLPFVTPPVVAALRAEAPAVCVDDEGRDQPLLAAYRTEDLRAGLPTVTSGARLRELVAVQPGLRRLRLGGHPPPWWDCDTPQQLAQAREWHDAR